MKKTIFNRLLLVLIYLIIGCTSSGKRLSLQDLDDYTNDPSNGLIKTIEKDEISLELIYRPIDLILAQHLKEVVDKDEISRVKEALDGVDYFILRISKNNRELEKSYSGDVVKYNLVINYLNNGISSDLRLINSKDTFSILETSFVPSFANTNSTSVLIAFASDLKNCQNDFKIVFDDPILGSGVTEFDFDIGEIRNIPKLKN